MYLSVLNILYICFSFSKCPKSSELNIDLLKLENNIIKIKVREINNNRIIQ